MKLKEFVHNFIPHNTLVMLWTVEEIIEDNIKSKRFNPMWRGMEWQIDDKYVDSDYFRVHKDVLPCPYLNHTVVCVSSVGLSGEFTDEVSLVINMEE